MIIFMHFRTYCLPVRIYTSITYHYVITHYALPYYGVLRITYYVLRITTTITYHCYVLVLVLVININIIKRCIATLASKLLKVAKSYSTCVRVASLDALKS